MSVNYVVVLRSQRRSRLRTSKVHKVCCVVASGALLAFLACSEALSQTKVTTVAGGYVGDGKSGSSATIQEPQYAAIDSSGNVYVADSLNHRIRKVTPTGIIHTVAGTGNAGSSGDG